MNKQTKNNC